MRERLNFKVNAGIKNIVGKELIHSDSIAVIELVKNAKDASASICELFFKNEIETNGEIIIADNGKGMTEYDIREKWLNVAYSEKKSKRQQYAGSKGVGRFSCDRLAENLVLYTKAADGDFLKLSICWGDFENREIDDEMSSISVWLDKLTSEQFFDQLSQRIGKKKYFDHGTVLVMEKLRATWPTSKLKKLISELEKFSPSIDEDIGIFLFSENSDKSIANKINRRIQNNIFDKLNFKTTRIESEISEDGQFIATRLFYQDKEVYRYNVTNPYSLLKNIKMKIYYIDPLTRAYFTRNMGIKPVEYGSIFLFYNNFRISPYGNVKNDWLGLDQRKAQGRARYFGTRELLGKIFITDTDNTFEVLSNREGLAQNQAFMELVAFDREDKTTISSERDEGDIESYGYVTNIIRQLENFVVNGLEWNRLFDKSNPSSTRVISETDVLKHPDRYTMRAISPERIRSVCQKLIKSNWSIEKISINEDLINNIYQESEAKYTKFLEDFLTKLKAKTYFQLSAHEKGSVKKIIEREIEAKKVAEKQRDEAEKSEADARQIIKTQDQKLEQSNKTIQQINSLNMFLKRTANQETEDLLATLHSIIGNATSVRNYVLRILKNGKLDDKTRNTVLALNEANSKTLNLAKYATLYNFSDKENVINGELSLFIHECLNQERRDRENIRLKIVDQLDLSITSNTDFIPLEVMMAVQNIIANAKKADATEIVIKNFKQKNGKICYLFSDNGKGLSEKYKSCPEKIFEKGETTTEGSGLGLYQIKRMVDKLKGRVSVLEQASGFSLSLEI